MSEADELLQRALSAFQTGDSEVALRLVNEALGRADEEGNEQASRAAMGLEARMLQALGRPDAALFRFDQTLGRFPDDGMAWYSRGVLLQELGRDEEALASFERATTHAPDDPDGWINRGRLLDDAGRCVEAVDCYEHALELDPDREIPWTNRGNSLLNLKRFEEALESYDEGLRRDPSSQPAMLGRSSALGALGQIDASNAARPTDPDLDPGELREQRRPLGERSLIVRYRVGRHSHPEMLDATASAMLELCGELDRAGDPLTPGAAIGFGWSMVTVVERDGDLLLCEPEFSRDPFRELADTVSQTLQSTVMQQLLHRLTDTEPVPCTFGDSIRLVPGALREPQLALVRTSAGEGSFSGWVAGPAGELERAGSFAGEFDEVPTAHLLRIRPQLIKALSLPPGYTVLFRGHAIVAVIDPDGGIVEFDAN